MIDTNQRDRILDIVSEITELSDEDRDSLCESLKKTKLSNIVKTLRFLEDRLSVIDVLKKLVYELDKFTNERDHIQKIIESNYWLFGEQYNLVSADKNFGTAIMEYYDKLNIDNTDLVDEDKRRMDIFISRKRLNTGFNGVQMEENIIVELKRPNVKIGIKQHRQIEDYFIKISSDPQFCTRLASWKFIVVGQEIEQAVLDKYNSWEEKNEQFLTNNSQKNGSVYNIYAMTWNDIFTKFKIQNNYIYEKLDINNDEFIKELSSNPDELTKIATKK